MNSAYKSPAYRVVPVPIEKIVPNSYNPNAVAPPEMRLLYDSIKEDGYTMPIVCYYSKKRRRLCDCGRISPLSDYERA